MLQGEPVREGKCPDYSVPFRRIQGFLGSECGNYPQAVLSTMSDVANGPARKLVLLSNLGAQRAVSRMLRGKSDRGRLDLNRGNGQSPRNIPTIKMINLSILIIFNILYDMTTVSATEAKQRFSALLDAAQREPVCIQKHERDVAVLLSAEEYRRLRADRWAEFDRLSDLASAEAKANGLTENILAEILAE